MTFMRDLLFRTNRPARTLRRPEAGRAGLNILLLAIAAGILAAAVVYSRRAEPAAPPNPQLGASLSPGTLSILNRLESPVELRFYSLLDPASVPDAAREFAGRVSQLLAEYESAGDGRITVKRINSPSDLNASAASADGIQPFNLKEGEACYLGVAIVGPGRKETLPLLSPEWEPALEADLSRAIGRAAQAAPVPRTLTRPSEEAAATLEAVKRAVPNLERVSQEEAARMLRQRALEESQTMARAAEVKIKEAEHRFNQAQQSGNEADQLAALKELQQLQADKLAQLQEIAAQTQARLDALKEFKKDNR